MNILLLGKNGQVGWELQRALAPLGSLVALDSREGDLSQPESLRQTLRAIRPDVIVNAAAYTAVDKAESESDRAWLINAGAVALLAEEARAAGALLVHYSTDYVYPGDGQRPWRETDATGPLNVYGQSKLAGEQAILAAGARHLIFRTSWVYAARGNNFAKTMLRLAKEKPALAVINDQHGAPTGADLIADTTAHAIRALRQQPALSGTYHLAAAGTTTWYDYAALVFAVARQRGIPLALTACSAVPTSAYPTPAARPRNSRLDLSRLEQTFGLTMPDWERGVRRMLDEVLDN
ncbi:dTDP-4-dehydrorhamnose reductase [Pantoea sp. 1.19]|uniref:dTDP-4-dehydrorhamnose reductase n=1 Tax=Pantoea sp. 1.19 TaxID=1925589 RepID=UPI000948E2B2|nr:dTDP-4-dehydrorhamnose reductase [Pantoea sp. 1.19]